MKDANLKHKNIKYINILEIPLIIVKYLPLILLITVFALVFSIIYSGFLKEKFLTSTEIEFRSSSNNNSLSGLLSGRIDLNDTLTGSLSGSAKNDANFFAHILKTPKIIDKIIDINKLKERYNMSNSSSLRIRFLARFKVYVNDLNLLEISYQDEDKILAYNIVKSIIQELENYYQWRSSEITKSSLNEINNILSQIEEEIKFVKLDMMKFQEKYGIFDIDQYSKSIADQLADLKMQLIQAQLEYKEKNIEYRILGKYTSKEMQIYREKINIIQNEINNLKTFTSSDQLAYLDLPKVNLEYLDIYTNLSSLNLIYEQLRLIYNINKLKLNENIDSMIIVKEPEIAKDKFYPYRSKIVKKFIFIAFIISIFLSFIIEFFYRSLNDEENREILIKIKDYLTPVNALKNLKKLYRKKLSIKRS
ncbi:MAG: hypothetical protein JXB50_12435 [Spirochaetes bacterium]|nr:hypothetical protein [Spirochaetota bacterium]